MLDIQIELIEEPEVELDANGLPIVPAPAVPPAQAQVVGDVPPQAAAANGAAPAQPAAAANGEPAQAGDNWGFRRNISIFQLARTVVATLFFPAMSSIAGDVLLRTLPKTWVTKPSIPLAASISLSSIFGGEKGAAAGTWRKGLLQEKWGRTLVGGATLILMKDAVHLYVLWRRAKLEGGRRVFDYDKKRKVYLRNGMVARDEN